MSLFCREVNGQYTKERPLPKQIVTPDGRTVFNPKADDVLQFNVFPFVEPTWDSATEKLGNRIRVGDTVTYEVIPLTQAEIDARLLSTKQQQFKEGFELLARISLAVFEKLRTDGVIAATDFPADIRQDYLDFKALVDELFPG